MWICERRADSRIIGSQNKPPDGVLVRNAVNCGERTDNLLEREIPDAEFISRRLIQDEADKDYTRKRLGEGPSIQDKLDDLFIGGKFSPAMTALIQAVNDKYPKP